MESNVSAISAATRRNILLGILDKDTTKNATAIKAGIPSTTFDRKLNNCGLFTVRELAQIANVLDLKLEDMFKEIAA